MPWELTIVSPNDRPLGDRDAVVALMSRAVPGITWIEEPPLLERIKDMPDHPFHALIPQWPEEMRRRYEKPKLLGSFDADDLSVQIYGFEEQPIFRIHLEVRGSGNPLPILAAICVSNGWAAVDDSGGKNIPLDTDAVSGWEKFREYRDRVIRSLARQ